MSTDYAKPEEISKVATAVLEEMNDREWKRMSLEEQAKNLSIDMAKLWKVHFF